MRLDKYLADMKVGSRSDVKKLIRSNAVKVNNETVKKADLQINETDIVSVNGTVVEYVTEEYILLHKPAGVLTATEDRNAETVMDLLDTNRKDLFPVGRLDKDTEGVLLITNNGALAHSLLSPKRNIDKIYYAEVDKPLPDHAKEILENPIEFKEFTSSKATYEKISDNSAYLTIHEGKYHQVKRMFEKVGCTVTYLKRIRFANLTLDGLEKGEYRHLTEEEIEALKNL